MNIHFSYLFVALLLSMEDMTGFQDMAGDDLISLTTKGASLALTNR